MSNTDRTSGLQRILKQIEADGLETINKFDRETNDELKKRQTEIIADAQSRATEIISAAKKRAAQTAENTKTGTDARIKKYILAAQSEILDECIDLGITRIKHMPDEKYFDLIEKLIIKYSDKGINTLLLSDADIKRMPKSFVNNINKTLAQKGASLTLSDERIDTEGGFI
ncbi:MAG: V-type ATP synthase subunit E, partial [Clostridiales bacterium]|nr:V-type ATP synthase subunit E [Clostridiales bacterium]